MVPVSDQPPSRGGADAAPPTRVASLLGHEQVETAVLCLSTLRRYSDRRVELRLHDDGTLTPADRERLARALGEPEILLRPEADERVGEMLRRRPATRAFRRANPLALKLVDAPLLADEPGLVFCDTDVLFLRPFAGLRPPRAGVGAVFMADRQSAYSVRSWQLLGDRRLCLPVGINTGLILARGEVYDPDLVEWFAGRSEYHRTPVWAEQTCWALLAGRTDAALLDPERWLVPAPGAALSGEVVAAHFVRPVRQHLAAAAQAAADRRGEAPVAVAIRPARPCTPFDLLADELRRRLGSRRRQPGSSR